MSTPINQTPERVFPVRWEKQEAFVTSPTGEKTPVVHLVIINMRENGFKTSTELDAAIQTRQIGLVKMNKDSLIYEADFPREVAMDHFASPKFFTVHTAWDSDCRLYSVAENLSIGTLLLPSPDQTTRLEKFDAEDTINLIMREVVRTNAAERPADLPVNIGRSYVEMPGKEYLAKFTPTEEQKEQSKQFKAAEALKVQGVARANSRQLPLLSSTAVSKALFSKMFKK